MCGWWRPFSLKLYENDLQWGTTWNYEIKVYGSMLSLAPRLLIGVKTFNLHCKSQP